MDKIQGYEIQKAVLFDNGRGFALGYDPKAPAPYVTWQFTDDAGKRDYYWGHYHGDDVAAAERDYSTRTRDYLKDTEVKIVQTEAPGLYKYYSTQRPVDLGTFPKPAGNAPDEIVNYDGRIRVENDTRLAWGHLTYSKPLTAAEQQSYELRPSRDNPDVKRTMEEQAQAVGTWEDKRHVPDQKRLTWFYPDFGSYVVKEYVTPEMLAERMEHVKAQERGPKRPIAEQMKDAQRQADKQERPASGKDAPGRGEDR